MKKVTKALILSLLLMFGLGDLALARDTGASERNDLTTAASNAQNSKHIRRRRHRRGRRTIKHYRRGRRRHKHGGMKM